MPSECDQTRARILVGADRSHCGLAAPLIMAVCAVVTMGRRSRAVDRP